MIAPSPAKKLVGYIFPYASRVPRGIWVNRSHQSTSLQWRHNGRDSVSNHQPHDCSLNRFLRRRSQETSKLRVTGLCAGNSPGTGEFPAQMDSDAENVSIWWRHHMKKHVKTITNNADRSALILYGTYCNCGYRTDKLISIITWKCMFYFLMAI